jgi:mRNA interferase MazF
MAGPARGEIFWADLEPTVGTEQGGVRPVLVVQNDVGNRFSPTTIIAAITSRLPSRDFPFLVRLDDGVLPRPSVVNCAQVRTVDKGRLKPEPLARLSDETMRLVDAALRVSLGLSAEER